MGDGEFLKEYIRSLACHVANLFSNEKPNRPCFQVPVKVPLGSSDPC